MGISRTRGFTVVPAHVIRRGDLLIDLPGGCAGRVRHLWSPPDDPTVILIVVDVLRNGEVISTISMPLAVEDLRFIAV